MLKRRLLGGLVSGLILMGQAQAQEESPKSGSLNFRGEQFKVSNTFTDDGNGYLRKYAGSINIISDDGIKVETSYGQLFDDSNRSKFGFKLAYGGINLSSIYSTNGKDYNSKEAEISSAGVLKLSAKVSSHNNETPYISQTTFKFSDHKNTLGVGLSLDNLGTITHTNLDYRYNFEHGDVGMSVTKKIGFQNQTGVSIPLNYSFGPINLNAKLGYRRSNLTGSEKSVSLGVSSQF